MLHAGKSWIRIQRRSLDFFNFSNPSSPSMALGLTQPLTEMSTRMIPGGVNHDQHIRLTSSLPPVSQLSRKYVILDILQPYRPPWPVRGIDLLMHSGLAPEKSYIYIYMVLESCKLVDNYLWLLSQFSKSQDKCLEFLAASGFFLTPCLKLLWGSCSPMCCCFAGSKKMNIASYLCWI
jgi:hypothetical protein